MKKLLYIFTLITLLASCESKPEGVMSRGKMEDVLYDYHLMQSLLEQIPHDKREKESQVYIQAIFDKYDITEAEFDSSLVYYNRHTEDLDKIYKNLQERYTEANQDIQEESGKNEMFALTEGGDTTNIWAGAPLVVLKPTEHLNYKSFVIKADSSFRRKDKYILTFNSIIIKEDQTNRNCRIVTGLSLTYKNGKTIGTTNQATVNSNIRLNLDAIDNEDIKEINVFYYYAANNDTRNLAFVDNIYLIRMHTKDADAAATDSVKTDTLVRDTVVDRHNRIHLSPEQIREQNQGEEKIKIKAAPDVRTPNSYGPRRRQPANRQRRTL